MAVVRPFIELGCEIVWLRDQEIKREVKMKKNNRLWLSIWC